MPALNARDDEPVADAGISAEAAQDGRSLGHTRWTNLRIAGFVLVLAR